MLQKRLDPWCNIFFCFVLPSLLPLLWGGNWLNGLLVAGFLRYVLVLHFTWSVNSFAHTHGGHPYEDSIHPAENPYVALATLGEG